VLKAWGVSRGERFFARLVHGLLFALFFVFGILLIISI
jgi:hypothetical protein